MRGVARAVAACTACAIVIAESVQKMRFAGVVTPHTFTAASSPLALFGVRARNARDGIYGPIQREYPELAKDALPDVTDRETVLALALMSSTSYYKLEDEASARDVRDRDHFGWDAAGVRGHVFASDDRKLVVIAFKGTSVVPRLDGGGGTIGSDKHADNLMFSCCCARVDLTWSPVCGCYRGPGQCARDCVRDAVRSEEASYYAQALAVFDAVAAAFPGATAIWVTGHSLGGALASLVAASRTTAAVTFSAPGAARYAENMGLALRAPLSALPVWNFGLSSDPIFTGRCTGPATSCYLSGYAMETVCRFGSDCTFDVDARWNPDLSTHRISWLIRNVLLRPDVHTLPVCAPIKDCVDCVRWAWV